MTVLILGDISGIQDFLFDIRERGGKQAATLRFRSLRLQFIVEAIARKTAKQQRGGESRPVQLKTANTATTYGG